jgi:hypothetical protein
MSRAMSSQAKTRDNRGASNYIPAHRSGVLQSECQTSAKLPRQNWGADREGMGGKSVKSFRVLLATFALSAIYATQAFAQSALMSGIAKPHEPQLLPVQFKLPFGMSAKKVRRILQNDGYEEIEITYLGILDAKADACRRGTRYRVKLRADGSYEYRNEIGKCRAVIKADDVRGLIRREGFRRIDIQDDGKVPYIATACRNDQRYSIEVSEFGDVVVKDRIGRCENEQNTISAQDLRRALRKDGYDRIKFTDRTPRRFIVEACQGSSRMRLEINRRGRLRDRERIGRCAETIRPRDLTAILAKAGYDRIDLVDQIPPIYLAEGCRGNNRMRIRINTWGETVFEKKIGDCAPPATVASLTEQLEKNVKNFRGISVREGKQYPFIADVCDDGQRRELYFSRYGEFVGKKDTGRCISERVADIVERLRNRGFRDVKIYVEGCRQRNGRQIRFELDEYGNRIKREWVGRCN